jgi:hypothetical protein
MLREGAQRLVAEAVQAEFEEFWWVTPSSGAPTECATAFSPPGKCSQSSGRCGCRFRRSKRTLLGLKVSARARYPHRIVEPFDREVVDVPS